ncbi:hypothetical protein ILUMI_11194 [Ignelater luminosus]|uniref:Integrase zinc-binding domain-containing protein n=1 Tax=Ignelater luminosus TaxID=2038154 RepID=A0A8K0GDF7_IGNLU|nr:hypothetical protein ILUMI_11194 [Ignelater luminosus]
MWKTYVYNRVVEIQKLTKDSSWRHCAGYLNPADLLTRGVSANKLLTTEYWLKGPEFLSRVDYEWSAGNDLSVQIDESVLCANIVSDSKTEILEPLFSLENYEHLEKCLRVTTYVKRAFRVKNFPLALTSDELSDAEMYWIKFTQQVAFSREVEDLKKNNTVSKTSSIWKLTPFRRLQESDLSFETANPIILPRKSPLVEKLIWKIHNRHIHSGINMILTEIRKRFWIIRARQTIKSLISKCVTCKKLRGKPGQEMFAPLPKNRMTPQLMYLKNVNRVERIF